MRAIFNYTVLLQDTVNLHFRLSVSTTDDIKDIFCPWVEPGPVCE